MFGRPQSYTFCNLKKQNCIKKLKRFFNPNCQSTYNGFNLLPRENIYFQLKDCNIIIASHVQNVFTLEFLVFIQVYEKGNFKEMFHYLRCTINCIFKL